MFWVRRFISDKDAMKSALAEVFIVCLLSLMPLFLLYLIDILNHNTGPSKNMFYGAFAGGQLYLYSFSLFGTLFWLCQKEHEHIDKFPPRKWFMLAIFVPMCLILGVYLYDPSLRKPLHDDLIRTSVIIYALYVIIYFLLTVFNNLRAPIVQRELDSGVDALKDNYRRTEDR
jgi:hypothetical protein